MSNLSLAYCQRDTKPRLRMDFLPDEILLIIFNFIPILTRLRKVRVCKRWKELILDPLSKKVLDFSMETSMTDEVLMKILKLSRNGPETIILFYCSSISNSSLLTLKRNGKFSRLQEIVLSRTSQIDSRTISVLLRDCPIKRLVLFLSAANVNVYNSVRGLWKTLEFLRCGYEFHHDKYNSVDNILRYNTIFPKLYHLDCGALRVSYQQAIMLGKACPILRNLIVPRLDVANVDQLLTIISKLKFLEFLCIHFVELPLAELKLGKVTLCQCKEGYHNTKRELEYRRVLEFLDEQYNGEFFSMDQIRVANLQ